MAALVDLRRRLIAWLGILVLSCSPLRAADHGPPHTNLLPGQTPVSSPFGPLAPIPRLSVWSPSAVSSDFGAPPSRLHEANSTSPSAILPPGLNREFIRHLAAKYSRSGGEHTLIETIGLVWRVSREERVHFLRLLAQVRAESDFNRDLISSAGAIGLLQIMPHTARYMGFDDVTNPEDNVRCGARYMNYLDRFATMHTSPRERWVATLACYNSGPSHYQAMVERTLRAGGTTNWSDVAAMYRRRFRRAPGQSLPETLIFVERNLESLRRFQDHLFSTYPGPRQLDDQRVRLAPSSCRGISSVYAAD